MPDIQKILRASVQDMESDFPWLRRIRKELYLDVKSEQELKEIADEQYAAIDIGDGKQMNLIICAYLMLVRAQTITTPDDDDDDDSGSWTLLHPSMLK